MSKQTCLVWLSVICGPALAMAADPMAIQSGRVLFTQAFTPTTPSPNGDGLGPLFNHVSCVACHHSGGVGGAGDNRFNARSLAIDQVRFAPLNRGHGVAGTLASLNPLLVTNSQQLRNSIPLPRFGGSPAFAKFRDALINPFNADWETAEFANSETVRREATEKVFHDSTNSLAITARIQSRNTTSLFGAGLIDRVPDSVILQAAKSKKRFPEIKGRPATLAFGKIGKFGWRANFATLLEFNENACVNELGLQSKSVPQPADPTLPNYKNTAVDISNDTIGLMNQFVASLPAPTRAMPIDSHHAQQIALGENRFAAVGCAECHVRDLGPAQGIYSDLLLHDMGPKLYDYNEAPPYRRDYVYDYEITTVVTAPGASYYGSPREVPFTTTGVAFFRDFRETPRSSSDRFVSDPIRLGREDDDSTIIGPATFRGTVLNAGQTATLHRVVRSKIVPTRASLEWRTPPLWSLRDSAPYLHDGRAETILEAISMHDGEAMATRNRFFALSYSDQMAMLAFLESLVAPTQGVIPVPKDFETNAFAVKLP